MLSRYFAQILDIFHRFFDIDRRKKKRKRKIFSDTRLLNLKNTQKIKAFSRFLVVDLSISTSSSAELTELGHNFRGNFLPVTTVRRDLRVFSLKSLVRGFPSVRNHLKDHGYHRGRDIRPIFIRHFIFFASKKLSKASKKGQYRQYRQYRRKGIN